MEPQIPIYGMSMGDVLPQLALQFGQDHTIGVQIDVPKAFARIGLGFGFRVWGSTQQRYPPRV